MHYFSSFETTFSSYLLPYTFSSIDYRLHLYLFKASSNIDLFFTFLSFNSRLWEQSLFHHYCASLNNNDVELGAFVQLRIYEISR